MVTRLLPAMVIACGLTMRMGWLSGQEAARIKDVLQDYGTPAAPPADIEERQYLDIMLSIK